MYAKEKERDGEWSAPSYDYGFTPLVLVFLLCDAAVLGPAAAPAIGEMDTAARVSTTVFGGVSMKGVIPVEHEEERWEPRDAAMWWGAHEAGCLYRPGSNSLAAPTLASDSSTQIHISRPCRSALSTRDASRTSFNKQIIQALAGRKCYAPAWTQQPQRSTPGSNPLAAPSFKGPEDH
ncbi:hypothetical protein DFH09DRAFT_1098516 [Mycena vulgaris]|nr:hypothetical protein DFH09DRAFT_1098516 [Mycena vulgaris]